MSLPGPSLLCWAPWEVQAVPEPLQCTHANLQYHTCSPTHRHLAALPCPAPQARPEIEELVAHMKEEQARGNTDAAVSSGRLAVWRADWLGGQVADAAHAAVQAVKMPAVWHTSCGNSSPSQLPLPASPPPPLALLPARAPPRRCSTSSA